jgi:hypothetical protein
MEQQDQIEKLQEQILKLASKMDTILEDSKSSVKAVLDKASKITPNPVYEAQDSTEDDYRKALSLMQAALKVIEKSYDFSKVPFNFLFEICSRSNSIASNCKLSRQQQITLILSFIPATSIVYKDLTLLDSLEAIFHYANTTTSTTFTRAELLIKIDSWHLDYSSFAALNESLATLRTYFADLSGQGYQKVNKTALYMKIIERIKKERYIPNFIQRMLDESALKIERESDAGVMLELLLAPLKYMLNQKPRHSTPLTHSIEAGGDNKGEQKSDTFKNTDNERGRKEKNKGKSERKSRDKSRADRFDNNNNRQRYENGRSKSRSRIKHVEPWPAGKKYLGPTGRLSTEIEKWFSNYCYKCGLGNHRSFECLIYPSKTVVMTLCNVCRSGFHTHCKNWSYVDPDKDQDNKGKARYTVQTPDSLQLAHDNTPALQHTGMLETEDEE